MAKLYFYYSAMNAGKSTTLLQSAYNYKERGMDTLIFTAAIDMRYGQGKVFSRIGLSAPAVSFDAELDLFEFARNAKVHHPKLECVLVDEAQFLSKTQVLQLTDIVDKLKLPVLAYGLRSDFLGEPFEGSSYLLILADYISEIKTVCGKKAIMNTRINADGQVVRAGVQILIGGNLSYIATCRQHFKTLETVPTECA
jgi:thymidine kinase